MKGFQEGELEEFSFMPSHGYKRLTYGKLNEVGFIVDVQFVH